MPAEKNVSVVILASGFSSRFGRNKLLEDLDGSPLLMHAIKNALEANHFEITVVVEPGNREVRNIIPPGVRVCENPGRSAGLSSAVRVGVESVSEDSDAVLFLVADQPFVKPWLIDRLIEEFREKSCGIVACSQDGVLKNPMLFSREYFDELCKIKMDVGARQVAVKHSDAVCAVEIKDPDTLLDVDTPSDMEKARKLSKK